MNKGQFRALELSGDELDNFIRRLVDKIYGQIWGDRAGSPDEAAIRSRLENSIIEALKEYAEYRSE